MFSTIFSEETAAAASVSRHKVGTLSSSSVTATPNIDQPKSKKKRNVPGNPDPEAEVIALSPKTLLATNRFVCEICSKGFQRDQNLQLHRRGHNLPWKLKQTNSKESRKRVYVCPESTCVYHDPSRALGDLSGIKKHFCRKHGEKKWKCDKCSKIYAVQSDWKAHSKTCGTREYRCDCGTLFSRKDSFVTHRAFCDALAEESARLCSTNTHLMTFQQDHYHHQPLVNASDFDLTTSYQGREITASLYTNFAREQQNPNPEISLGSTPFVNTRNHHLITKPEFTGTSGHHQPLFGYSPPSAVLSATALLQKAATIGATSGPPLGQTMMCTHLSSFNVGLTSSTWPITDSLTRDFLGLTTYVEQQHVQCTNGGDNQLLKCAGTDGNMGVSSGFPEYDPSMFKAEGGFGSWR